MDSGWDEEEARRHPGELGLRVYSSRLLGREPTLVLHGGGNTSVKCTERNRIGVEERILYVKGSGRDLATIEADGFAPVRLDHLRALARLDALSDAEMVNELRTQMTRASAPTPSVEAILHAVIPHRFVDHTHADVVLTLSNSDGGEARIRELYGADCVVVPYTMPGFELARECAARFEGDAHPGTVGMILMHHGVFSFADDARESYERMIELVTRAEDCLRRQGAWEIAPVRATGAARADAGGSRRIALARLRHDVSRVAGRPMILINEHDARVDAFVAREDLDDLAGRGPVTPDHVLRTRRVPLLGRDVDAYAEEYRRYFETHAAGAGGELTMLDPAPRIVLDRELGLVAIGASASAAGIARDIYRQSMDVLERAAALGGYRALPAAEIFRVEYWELEQAKLGRQGSRPALAGEVALVTGAASGIGRACAQALLAGGAAVVGLDVDPRIDAEHSAAWRGIRCDVTDAARVSAALEEAVRAFGGLDMLVLNAGAFAADCPIADLADDEWRRAMRLNLDANLALMRTSHPLLALAPAGGRVVVIGSRNVRAPGPGAAAYSASKAALTQLARVAALEWAADGIRVNVVHPDAVFDTGLWTAEVLAARARRYGLSVAEYRSRNLLGVEVAARDVGRLAADMCGPSFARTTGAQVPVDGGNERAI